MVKNNQLIKFEGESIILPPGFEWVVHNYSTPSGMRRLRRLKFSDFDRAVHKWKNDHFHLFELRRENMKIMAYCIINKLK